MTIYSDKNTTQNLIDEAVTLSDTYVSIGEKVNTKGLDEIALWLKGNRNDADTIYFRIACYLSEDSTDPFYTQIQLIGSDIVVLSNEGFEVPATDDAFNLVTPLGISTLVPYIQVEAKVGVDGATAAEMSEAYISCNRR